MSHPVQIVQASYEAFGRGDMPALVALLSDDVEWIHRGEIGVPCMGRFIGKEAVTKWFGLVAAADDIQAAPVFRWNHDGVMRAGARGLARHLGVRLIDAY